MTVEEKDNSFWCNHLIRSKKGDDFSVCKFLFHFVNQYSVAKEFDFFLPIDNLIVSNKRFCYVENAKISNQLGFN